MSYLILGFVALAVLHFIYETMIAPTLRQQIMYEVFKLRDELRTLKIAHDKDLDDRHFYYLQDSLNCLLNLLPRLEIMTLAGVRHAANNDPELAKRLSARLQILDDCQIEDVKEIRRKSVELAYRAVQVNSGAWSFYGVRAAIVHQCSDTIVRWAKRLISLSESDLKKVAPDRSVLAVHRK